MSGLGVVAVGDSIINGGGPQRFTTPQSWAQTLAERADLPFTKYAKGGHTSQQVVDAQLPRIVRQGYDIGTVTVGANDLLTRWDPNRFEGNLSTILTRLADVSDRVVVSNLPDAFREDPTEVNRIVGALAAASGSVLVDVRDMGSPRWLRPDRVHPTAIGLAEIGYRAADALGIERLPVDNRTLSLGYRARHRAESLGWAARVRVRSVLR